MRTPSIAALLAASAFATNLVLAAPGNPAPSPGSCGKIVTIETHDASTTRYALAQGTVAAGGIKSRVLR